MGAVLNTSNNASQRADKEWQDIQQQEICEIYPRTDEEQKGMYI